MRLGLWLFVTLDAGMRKHTSSRWFLSQCFLPQPHEPGRQKRFCRDSSTGVEDNVVQGRCSKEQRRSLKWPGLRRRPVRRSQRALGGHQSGQTILALVWSHVRKDNGVISTRSRTCTTTGSMRLRSGGSMRWVVKSTASSLGLISAQDENIMVRV